MPRLCRRATFRARALRRAMTPAERALWALLRGDRLRYKFRRQHPIGPFIVDCCCVQARLVLEVDGPIHRARRHQDRQRDRWLRDGGWQVVRFSNQDLLEGLRLVEHRIRSLLADEVVPLYLWERGDGSPEPSGG